MRIAIDAMGGDEAPREIVKGALASSRDLPDVRHILVGDPARIDAEIGGPRPANVDVFPSTQVIGMNEHPVEALRAKKDSSILNCARLVDRGEADALFGAGNTGAVVAASFYKLGLLEGVKRPGIAVPLPNEKGHTLVCDAGANIACKPVHLVQYAVMAALYSRYVFRSGDNPRIGVLNIGEEEGKGNDLAKETLAALRKTGLNVLGNVEGQDIYNGRCDVAVCDGFVGNIVLKTSEGLGEFALKMLRRTADESDPEEARRLAGGIARAEERLDWSSVGGAPLLGVKGAVIIGHGRSRAKAVANAVRVARDYVENRVGDKIVAELQRLGGGGWLGGWFGAKPGAGAPAGTNE